MSKEQLVVKGDTIGQSIQTKNLRVGTFFGVETRVMIYSGSKNKGIVETFYHTYRVVKPITRRTK